MTLRRLNMRCTDLAGKGRARRRRKTRMGKRGLPSKLQLAGRDKPIEQLLTDRKNRAAVTEVLAQILQPEAVWNQRCLGLHNHEVLGTPARSDLQDQAAA